jgi:SanA protein
VSLALILGASVYGNGRLSPVLEERVKTAIGLYKTGVVKKILVSGDNSTPSYNEVIPIRDYLLENGIFDVPAEDIFVDFAGFNTYDSMYRAQEIFHAKNVLIVTQSFHLPRAIYVARSVGLNAYGVPARGGLSTQNTTREIFATVKTFFEVITNARPYFLGRAIPIEGDGRESLR